MRLVVLGCLGNALAVRGSAIAASGPCAGKDLLGPAANMLRGAHLTVFELVWPPYAAKDASVRLSRSKKASRISRLHLRCSRALCSACTYCAGAARVGGV